MSQVPEEKVSYKSQIFIEILVKKMILLACENCCEFKNIHFPFMALFFFSRKYKRVEASEHTKESQRMENGANTKRRSFFFFYFPLFFFFFQWDAASGWQQKLLMQEIPSEPVHLPPVSWIFHWKNPLLNFWVPAVITGDSNKLPVMSNSKNLPWQLDKEHY